MSGETLKTARFELVPVTLAMVEAIFYERDAELARLLDALLPVPWPGKALIERAFCADLDAIRKEPDMRLWGDRIIVDASGLFASSRDVTAPVRRRVIGSVIFHGSPTADGLIEIAYGIERYSQGQGVATEAVAAQVEWALAQPEVRRVRATTPPWHQASRRVLEKCGFVHIGDDEHDALGEVVVYQRAR